MEASVFECSVCGNLFDSKKHKPLCMMCGHTFCSACIKRIEKGFPKSCPYCQRAFDVSSKLLPVNYLVIPPEDVNVHNKCAKHGHEREYFCVECKSSVCKKCTRQEHREHRFELMEDFMDNDACVADVKGEICATLTRKLECLRSAIAVQDEVFNMIGTARTWKLDVHEGRKVLSALQDTVVHDLEMWQGKEVVPSSSEKKRKIFRELIKQYESFEDEERRELRKIKEKLTQLQKDATKIQLMVDEQLGVQGQEEAGRPTPLADFNSAPDDDASDAPENLKETQPSTSGHASHAPSYVPHTSGNRASRPDLALCIILSEDDSPSNELDVPLKRPRL